MLRVTQFTGQPPGNPNPPKPKPNPQFGSLIAQVPNLQEAQTIVNRLQNSTIIGTEGPGFDIRISGTATHQYTPGSKQRYTRALVFDSKSRKAELQAAQETSVGAWLNEAFPSDPTWLTNPSKDPTRGQPLVASPKSPTNLVPDTRNPFTVTVPKVNG